MISLFMPAKLLATTTKTNHKKSSTFPLSSIFPRVASVTCHLKVRRVVPSSTLREFNDVVQGCLIDMPMFQLGFQSFAPTDGTSQSSHFVRMFHLNPHPSIADAIHSGIGIDTIVHWKVLLSKKNEGCGGSNGRVINVDCLYYPTSTTFSLRTCHKVIGVIGCKKNLPDFHQNLHKLVRVASLPVSIEPAPRVEGNFQSALLHYILALGKETYRLARTC